MGIFFSSRYESNSSDNISTKTIKRKSKEKKLSTHCKINNKLKAKQPKKLVIKEISLSKIKKKIINENGIPRVGGTKREPKLRAREYERQGYSGIMFYAKTSNIKFAENDLLELANKFEDGYNNKHRKSNLRSVPGYIYIIKIPDM